MAPPDQGVGTEPHLPAEAGKCFSQIVLEEVQHGDHCGGHWERRARVEGRSPEMSPQGKWVLEVNEVEGTRLGYYGKVTQGLRTRHGEGETRVHCDWTWNLSHSSWPILAVVSHGLLSRVCSEKKRVLFSKQNFLLAYSTHTWDYCLPQSLWTRWHTGSTKRVGLPLSNVSFKQPVRSQTPQFARSLMTSRSAQQFSAHLLGAESFYLKYNSIFFQSISLRPFFFFKRNGALLKTSCPWNLNLQNRIITVAFA